MNQTSVSRKLSILRAKKIAPVLSSTPMTAAEINAALDAEYTSQQIADAVKLISGCAATRVMRATINEKGLQVQKEYAAYYLKDPNHPNEQSTFSRFRAKRIATVLDSTPKTAADINAALDAEYTSQQIADAVKLISGCSATRVVRATINEKWLQVQKEYAAYYLEGPDAGVVLEPRRAVRPQPDGSSSESAPAVSMEAWQERAKAIAGVLTHSPMTVLEINAALHSDYTALQVANVLKLIPDVGTCKVRRTVTYPKGEKVEREYTAYFIKERR